MAIDNIKEIREICDEYNIWLHGDGANGGVLIFSSKYRSLVRDIHLCDSVSLDPHKAMGLNYPTSVFLCRRYKDFNSVISNWTIINKKGSFDLGSTTPFLNSREFNSVRLWLLLNAFGLKGVAKMIDNKIDATKKIYLRLKPLKNKEIMLWNKPMTFSILFQIVPHSFRGKSKDKTFFYKLSKAQKMFKKQLENIGIEIHEFELPILMRYPKAKCNGFTTVLSIQNAHEKIPDDILVKLIKAIRNYYEKN